MIDINDIKVGAKFIGNVNGAKFEVVDIEQKVDVACLGCDNIIGILNNEPIGGMLECPFCGFKFDFDALSGRPYPPRVVLKDLSNGNIYRRGLKTFSMCDISLISD